MRPTAASGALNRERLRVLRHSWRGLLLRPLGFLVLAFLAGCSSASKGPPVSSGGDSTPPPVVREALHLLEMPYRFGEETPERGFDCSGLVHFVYGRYGVHLPRTAEDMAFFLAPLEESLRRPGDLVFFNTTGKPYSHVGIYLGENRFVHASSAQGKVIVSDFMMPYWSDHYEGARRPSLEFPAKGETMGRWMP